MDPDIRRQAEETVRACQEQLALFDEERKVLDKRQADMKAEDAKIEERISEIKRKREQNRAVQKNRTQLEAKQRSSDLSFFKG